MQEPFDYAAQREKLVQRYIESPLFVGKLRLALNDALARGRQHVSITTEANLRNTQAYEALARGLTASGYFNVSASVAGHDGIPLLNFDLVPHKRPTHDRAAQFARLASHRRG